jgi:cell division septation protein DedD
MGVVVGRAAEPPPDPVDPLAKLDRQTNSKAAPGPNTGSEPVPKVDAADLSFPATLGDTEERPEVLAALKAAADEEAALAPEPAQPDPAAAMNAASPRTVVAVDEALGDTVAAIPAQFEADEPSEVATEELIASVPAAVAAGPGARSLPKTARHDPLMAKALRNDDDNGEISPRGHDGEFTLQVISYDSPEPSRAFAEGLRAKGHAAFVVAADIPDRGRYYRVRIGPFKNRFQADAYRRKFETDEQMNTFVVREKPDA